jgi:glutamine synthetase
MMLWNGYDGSDPVEKFGGAQLIQQEPDASSFQMEESEIHLKQEVTLLHPTSPAFILGTTLCIPTVLFLTPEKL